MKISKTTLVAVCFLLAAPAWASQEAAKKTEDKAADAAQDATKEAVDAAQDDNAEQHPLEDCRAGAVFDDGTVETGYSFVPSSQWGTVIQRFHSSQFPSTTIKRVCVCWLRTRADSKLEFEVVFYKDEGGRPAAEPFASAPGRARDVPEGVANAGRFYPVIIRDVEIPRGNSYIGVRWNPATDDRFFVCANHSEGSEIVQAYQKDDRAKGWDNMLTSRDPSFHNHRSILLRAAAKPIWPLFRQDAASASPSVDN